MARTVHRLQAGQAVAAIQFDLEHVVAIHVPMAGGAEQRLIDQLRGLDFHITSLFQPPADEVFQRAEQGPALRMPEYHAGRFILLVEQAHFAAQAAMIALFRFGQHEQILVKLFLGGPGGAANPLKLRILGIAAPIGAGHAGQFEGMARLGGGRQMRPGAQVQPVALGIDRDFLLRRDFGNPFGLEGLALTLEEGHRLVPGPDFAHDRQVAIDDLVHPLLDRHQIVRGERVCPVEIVIEAGFGRWAERHLRAGVKLLHRLRQDMGAVVPDEVQDIR